MKKLLFTLLSVTLITLGASAQGVLKFEKETHDFGKQNEAGVINTVFTFTNTGNKPVVITNAQAQCGCTTPTWPQEPIIPGAKAKINVGYNTAGRVGTFDKTVTVMSNAENGTVVLHIKGTVVAKPADKQ